MNAPNKILIIGIGGGLAQITAKLLIDQYPDCEIIGVDSRDISNINPINRLTCHRIKYSRGHFENLFRNHNFDVVYHLARVTHSNNNQSTVTKRLNLSVTGTNQILELSLKFKVKRVVILSTFHVYGALADNSVFLAEEAPLKASIKNPELRDVVEMDQISTNWMWKNQNSIETIVLRPCNIIGSKIRNAMTNYLSTAYAPYPIDYNPHFQFIHEFDMANILKESAHNIPTGIYNVATDEHISIRDALKLSGSKGFPMPMSLAGTVTKSFRMVTNVLPDYLIDYLKFSCLIDNKELKKHIPENFFRFSLSDTLSLIRLE